MLKGNRRITVSKPDERKLNAPLIQQVTAEIKSVVDF